MTDSPYSRIGARLVDQGYSAIPVLPGSKRPGTYSRGRWFGDLDWTRYCDRLPTSIETEIWNRWPDAGVCIALGLASGGLVAIDVDTDNQEVIAAIRSALPDESPVQKCGRKGYSAFYRARPAVVSCAFNIAGERALDLLAHGKQTVVPPTIHPDSGREYEWLTASTLEDLTTDRLPLLPDDIAARLGEALAPHGFFAPLTMPEASDSDGDTPWSEVKETAIAKYDAWLPELGIFPKRGRHAAVWRGGDNPTSVQIDEKGIYDHREGRGYSPHDVVMGMHACDFPTADKWLRERLGFKDPPPVVFTFRKPAVDEPAAAQEKRPIIGNLQKVDPFDHTIAGGLIEMTAKWIMSTSFIPSREMSLMAAIGIAAAFYGRRYVGPTNLAPNLYLICLATTGGGKDAPLRAIKNFFTGAGGFEHWMGSGDPASDSVMEKKIRDRPSHISTLDEAGAWLQEGSARNAGSHQKGRRKILLSLYGDSQVGGTFLGKDRAGDEVMASSQPVRSPCMSIFGVSTPETFFKGLTEENTRDGLLNRLTLVHVPPCEDEQDIPPDPSIPAYIKRAYDDAFDEWIMRVPADKRKAYRSATTIPYFVKVEYADDEAKACYKRLKEWQKEEIKTDPNSDGIVKRAAEQTLKLAMIRAVSRDPNMPAVTADDIAWGEAIVYQSVEMLSRGIHNYMSGSDFEDNCKLLLRHVNQAGEKGITRKDLRKRAGVGKMKPQDFEMAVKHLTEAGSWEPRKAKNGVRYVALGGRVAVVAGDDE